MSEQRFTPEFRQEVVSLVTVRSYAVAAFAACLRGPTHSLYIGGKSVSCDSNEQQTHEVLDAKSEILCVRSQRHRTKEEHDILKKPCGTWPWAPNQAPVPVYQRAPASTRYQLDVLCIEGVR